MREKLVRTCGPNRRDMQCLFKCAENSGPSRVSGNSEKRDNGTAG